MEMKLPTGVFRASGPCWEEGGRGGGPGCAAIACVPQRCQEETEKPAQPWIAVPVRNAEKVWGGGHPLSSPDYRFRLLYDYSCGLAICSSSFLDPRFTDRQYISSKELQEDDMSHHIEGAKGAQGEIDGSDEFYA